MIALAIFISKGFDPITVIGVLYSIKGLLDFTICYTLCCTKNPSAASRTIFLSPLDGAFSDLKTYLKLSMSSGMMGLSEETAFQGMIILSGWLGGFSIEALTLLISLHDLLIEFGYGFSYGVASMVGNYVGAR